MKTLVTNEELDKAINKFVKDQEESMRAKEPMANQQRRGPRS